jgi:hypothetical protein
MINETVAAKYKEAELMLVHVMCWRVLALPEILDMNQVLERHKHCHVLVVP